MGEPEGRRVECRREFLWILINSLPDFPNSIIGMKPEAALCESQSSDKLQHSYFPRSTDRGASLEVIFSHAHHPIGQLPRRLPQCDTGH